MASKSTHLAVLTPTAEGGLSHSLINTHFAFLIGNPDIVLEKHIPSRFDHGKCALLALRAHRAHLPSSNLYIIYLPQHHVNSEISNYMF